MKIRNLLIVLLALGIVGGIAAFARARFDDSRGSVSVWYLETDPLAPAFSALAEEYNTSVSRSALPVACKGFADEQALADAFDSGTPDLLLCTHARAFDMSARSKLVDVSEALGSGAPGYPRQLLSRNAAIGKSFFPLGLDVQVLLVNSALCDAQGFDTMEALCTSAHAYTAETGRPFFAADSFSSLFFTCLLREGETFTADVGTGRVSENYATLYNLLANCAYEGALSLAGGDATQDVADGALPCALVRVSSLAESYAKSLALYPLPSLSSAGEDALGTAYGLAVMAGGCRSTADIAAFLAWLFSGNRDNRLALRGSLIPAQRGSLITRDPLWSDLMNFATDAVIALPEKGSDFAANREHFETQLRERLAFLSE